MSQDERSTAFEALRNHPDYAIWMAHDPGSLTSSGCRDAMGLLMLLALGIGLSVLSLAFLPQLALVPIGFVAVGLIALVAQIVRKPKHTGPLIRRPARILNIQAQLADAVGPTSQSLYLIVLETEDGQHHSVEADAALASDLQTRAVGIAFCRGQGLVGFTTLFT